jgi:transglutaminase-like putative cysteine protease
MSFAPKKLSTTKALTRLDRANDRYLLYALWCGLLPHCFYLPKPFVILLILTLLLWQGHVIRHGSYQRLQIKSLRIGVLVIGLLLIWAQYHTFLGVEASCAVLVLMLLSKAFETKSYRDAVIVYNLNLFVVASVFLYAQLMSLAVAALLAVVMTLYGLFFLQQHNDAYQELSTSCLSPRSLARQAQTTIARLLLLALPLLLLLFFLIPRIPPLWRVPSSIQAQTGLNEVMSPGDIAHLSQSNALVLRAFFADWRQMPRQEQLYWRAMVLDYFDGRSWRKTPSDIARLNPHNLLKSPQIFSFAAGQQPHVIPYRIWLQPSATSWFYALEYSHPQQHGLLLHQDLSLSLLLPIQQRQSFELALIRPKPAVNLHLTQQQLLTNTQFPSGLNPRAQHFAALYFERAQQDPQVYVQLILQWIKAQNFVYTLSPPLLQGAHRLDEFLFETRSGFCEHYATAFVSLMRMVGIPARVVVGYQGGAWSYDRQSWEVRQLDAHAWAEVWLARQGWVRVDPTAVLAATRLTQGMQSYAQQNTAVYGTSMFSTLQAKRSQWLTELKIWSDHVNNQWQNHVVSFDQAQQQHWLKRWSINSLTKQWLLLLLGLLLLLVFFAVSIRFLKKNPATALDRALWALSRRLSQQQLSRPKTEPVLSWLKRIERQRGASPDLTQLQQLYTTHVYISALDAKKLKTLLKLLRKYPNNSI